MKLLQIPPDIITMNTCIYGYGVALDPEAAVAVVEERMPRD